MTKAEVEVGKIEESLTKLHRETEDLNQEINYESQRQELFKAQLNDIKTYNDQSKNKLRQSRIDSKTTEELYIKAVNEKARIKEEIGKITRTGRQPGLKGSTK